MSERRKWDRRHIDRDHLMTDQDVAQMTGVSVNTVRYWRQTGILPFVRMGKYPRIWASVVRQLFKKPIPYSTDSADTIISAGDIRR